jgi:hypothetical protein
MRRWRKRKPDLARRLYRLWQALAFSLILLPSSPALSCLAGESQGEREFCARPPAQAPLRLPDLYTLPPTDLRLYQDQAGEQRSIRFSNSVINLGPGSIELVGTSGPDETVVKVRQKIFRTNGQFTWREVGETAFHPEHEHWHWTRFSTYEIWSVTPSGELGRRLRESGKVGYCLRDNASAYDVGMAGVPLRVRSIPEEATYGQCGWQLQGISPGWTDIYDYKTPGQNVDLTGLPNGVYALRSTVDPENYLFELDESNNTAIIYFRLEDDQIVVQGSMYP